MVAVTMRSRFDEFGKQLVRAAVEGHCSVETDVEVPADTLRIDLWVTPREAGASSPNHPGLLMSTRDVVENWRREAIQEGARQGLEQGVRLGLEQAERKVLLRLLRRRFAAQVDDEIERRVAAAPSEQVEVWTDRIFSAATLTELLAD